MPSFGAFRNNSLILFLGGDSTALNKTLEQSQRNVTNFARTTEKANARIARSNAEVAKSAGFLGRGGKANQALRGGLSGFGAQSSFLFGSGAFIGAAAAVGSIKLSVDAASDLNEQITKTIQVFGKSSKAVLDWSEDTSKSMGIARGDALATASTFGNLFSAQGFGNLENSKLSRGLVKLASDLASFNNVNVTQVLEDLQSGIVGEIEPVRKYGADLRVARVQQEALAESGKENVKQLTRQELTLARIKLLYRDTAKAQGDFQRTSGGLANQQRILTAQTKDLAAKTGSLLIPAAKGLVTQLNVVADVAGHAADFLNKLANVKIPPIHIPLLFDTPGGTVGHAAGSIFTLSGFVNLTKQTFANLINDFRDTTKAEADKSQPIAAAKTAAVFNDFVGNVLTSAMNLTHPDVNFNDLFNNVLSGLKTQLGPILKDIPKKLQESLLDVEISTPDNHKALIGVLEKQKNALEEALKDPRLKRDDRIDIKEKLKGVIGQIDSENNAIKSAVQAAADKRTAALQEAQRKAEEAKQKQLDHLRKIKEAREKAAQKVAELLQSKQFRALGLSSTGDQIVPGVDNLKKQLSQLTDQLGGDVAPKVESQLKSIGKVLSGTFGKVTLETRSKIKDLFDTIRSEFDKQAKSGPLTATTALNTNQILKGLGLGPDATKELRARLAKFNSAGVALSGSGVATRAGGFPVFGAPSVNVDVTLDGEKITKNVTVRQQKRTTRNPTQKRGPIGGRI